MLIAAYLPPGTPSTGTLMLLVLAGLAAVALLRPLIGSTPLTVLAVAAVIAAGWPSPPRLSAAPAASTGGCQSRACQQRVERRAAHTRWRRIVNAYPAGVLDARMRCESGGHGGYKLSTTGNGVWFAFQFEPRAWTGAGGRIRHGRPVGVWTTQPSRLEQQYRAIRWERVHGGDPWPACP